MHAVLALPLALALASAPARAAAMSRAGGACLFESGNTATSAATKSPIAALTASWFFRVDVPWSQLYPILSYTNSSGHQQIAFGAQHKPWVFIHQDEEAATYPFNDEDGFFALGTGEWHHAAFTWNSSDGYAAIYENGKLIGSGHQYKGLVLPAGGRFLFPTEMWDERLFGHADEVTVWGVALSASEVAAVSRGSASVRPASRLLHWSCDDIDDAAAIADDASGAPATVTRSASAPKVPAGLLTLKVPSTLLMGVDSNASVVAVRPDAETPLGLPVGTRVLSLPAEGELRSAGAAVAAGAVLASPASYVPAGRLSQAVRFATSFAGAVVLVPNAPPAPLAYETPVADYESVVAHAAYFTADAGSPGTATLTSIDAQGDRLAAWVAALPQTGRVLQYNDAGTGAAITAVPAGLTDPGLRFVYVPDEGSAGQVDSVLLVVGDALANSTAVRRTFRVMPTVNPPTPLNATATTGADRRATINVTVRYNYRNEGRMLATLPRYGSLADPATGGALASLSSVALYQWAATVVDFSSKWSDKSGPEQVLGEVSAYPAYGDLPGTWSFNQSDPAVHEFVHVRYPTPVFVTNVITYEVEDVDSVIKIEQLSADGKSWEVLFSRPQRTAPSPLSGLRKALAYNPTLSAPAGAARHAVRDIRVWFGYSQNEWPLIDAIKLVGTVEMPVVELPASNSVLYTAGTGTGASSDAFEVYSEMTPAIQARIDALFATPAPAKVSVTIGQTTDGVASVAPLAALVVAAIAVLCW
eukprot:m51a1_g7076 hypothetical protein (758) ;mRNA; f:218956-221921